MHSAEIYSSTTSYLNATSTTLFDANASTQIGTDCVPNTSTDRITVQNDGTYEIYIESSACCLVSATNVRLIMEAYLNGSVFSRALALYFFTYDGTTSYGTYGSRNTITTSRIVDLSKNDYIQIKHLCSSSSMGWSKEHTLLRVVRVM